MGHCNACVPNTEHGLIIFSRMLHCGDTSYFYLYRDYDNFIHSNQFAFTYKYI